MPKKMQKKVKVLDTTLRDGQQGEDIDFTPEDMIRIALELDKTGISYIEGGWPGSNPKFDKFFELAQKESFKNARLAAFGSTRKKGKLVKEDDNIKALIGAKTPVVVIVGKSWKLHVQKVMNNTLTENLAMIRDSVAYLKKKGKEVMFDAEHFFDGFKEDSEYAISTLQEAVGAGVDCVTLCDTNGGTLHFDIEDITREVKERLGEEVEIGIHAHNDGGLAVANTLSAVRAGATVVHGTINGYGERCGNADLTSVIPDLQIKMGYQCIPDDQLLQLRDFSRFVSDVANMTPFKGRPFVGDSAFAHKGGVHVSAIIKLPLAYEHILPEMVGNRRRVLVSDLAGKSNIEYKAKELGLTLEDDSTSRDIVSEVKRQEGKGYKYEAADDSLRLLIMRLAGKFVPQFEVESFKVIVEKEKGQPCKSSAMVKLSSQGREEMTAAEGNGPVSALDNAFRQGVKKFYPVDLSEMKLVDFKVRVMNGREGTDARVRVAIGSRGRNNRILHTVGVSTDVIEAAFEALTDSFHSELAQNGRSK